MSEEKCWWYFDAKRAALSYHNNNKSSPWLEGIWIGDAINLKNPRNWYYGTRKNAELLAKYAENRCLNCIEDAVGLTTEFSIPRPICGGHAIRPDVMYPPHWLEEKPKRADETSAPISHRPTPKWFVCGTDKSSLSKYCYNNILCDKCEKTNVPKGAMVDDDNYFYCPTCRPDLYSWDDEMPGKNDEVDTGKHHSVDAEPAAPAPLPNAANDTLTRDPMRFTNHLEGCHWSGYTNYNYCSCNTAIHEPSADQEGSTKRKLIETAWECFYDARYD